MYCMDNLWLIMCSLPSCYIPLELDIAEILLLNYQDFLSLFCFPDVVCVLEDDRMFYGVGKRLLASGILFLTDRLLSIFYRYLICYIIWSFEVGAQKGHAGHYS